LVHIERDDDDDAGVEIDVPIERKSA